MVEVSEASLRTDREVKLPLYARSGVPEVWIVDLEAERVEAYRRPGPEGYAVRETVGRGGELSIQELPGATVPVDEILG